MNRYYQTLTNTRGDSLPGFRAQVVAPNGAVVDIFADRGGTRFTDASGGVVNYVIADREGLVEFYWEAATGQIFQMLEPSGDLVKAIPGFADNFVFDNLSGDLPESMLATQEEAETGADVPKPMTPLRVKEAIDTLGVSAENLASPDPGKGAALVGLPPGGTVAEAIRFVTPQMFGAKGDGVTDDSAALQTAFTFRNVRIPAGTYMVEPVAGVEIFDNSEIVIERGAVIKALPTSAGRYAILWATARENITIRGEGVVQGERNEHTGTTGEWGYGLQIWGCDRVKVEGLTLKDCWGDGMIISTTREPVIADRTASSNISITRVLCDNNRRQGLSVIGCVGLDVSYSTFQNTNGIAPQYGVDLEPDHAVNPIVDATFDHCWFINNETVGLATAGPLDNCRNLTVTNCWFVGNKSYAFSSQIPNTIVKNCHAVGDAPNGTSELNYGGFTISDGVVEGCTATKFRRSGFGTIGSGDVTIRNCRTIYSGDGLSADVDPYFLCIGSSAGSVLVEDSIMEFRVNGIRTIAGSGLDRLTIQGNRTRNFNYSGSFGASYPFRLIDGAVSTPVICERNIFEVVDGSLTNGAAIAMGAANSYVVRDNDVSGWSRTDANWYSKAAGAGVLSFGPGNTLPSGKYGAASLQTYTVSNVTTDRTLDADATTIEELADVVGTLIADLRAQGIVL